MSGTQGEGRHVASQKVALIFAQSACSHFGLHTSIHTRNSDDSSHSELTNKIARASKISDEMAQKMVDFEMKNQAKADAKKEYFRDLRQYKKETEPDFLETEAVRLSDQPPDTTTKILCLGAINYAESTNILAIKTRRSSLADICNVDIPTLKNAQGDYCPATIDNMLRFFPCDVEVDIQGNMITSIIQVKNAVLPPDSPDSETSIVDEEDNQSEGTATDPYSIQSSDNNDDSENDLHRPRKRNLKILILQKDWIAIQKLK